MPLYPETEALDRGMLAVGDGNEIYYASYGNPNGIPALILHGGPGSGHSARSIRLFDPAKYRVFVFDQRGCGLSRPHASEPGTNLSANTTAHLVRDIEVLREHLGIETWLVFGMSWGSTLGLAYALRHIHRVTSLVLAGVTTTRRSEIDWLYRGIAPLFPEEWARFTEGARALDHDRDLVAAYYRLLQGDDKETCERAAQSWHDWEATSIGAIGVSKPSVKWSDPAFCVARAKIITHYFHHNAWLEDGYILKNAERLNGKPGVMIQGRCDLEAPLVTAWELSQVWRDGDLVIVENAGHSPFEAEMCNAIIAATERMATLLYKATAANNSTDMVHHR